MIRWFTAIARHKKNRTDETWKPRSNIMAAGPDHRPEGEPT